MADQNFKVKKGLEVGIGGTVITTSSSGNVGLGTTNPTSKLWVNGDGYFIGSVTSAQGFYVNGELVGSGTVSVGNIVGTGLSISGISTVGVLSATSIGIGTTNAQQNVWVEGNGYFSGVVTATKFVGQLDAQSSQAQNVGFATTAINVIGGIASVSQLSVSGLSTVGILTATSIGIGTTNAQQNVWVEGNGYFSGVVTATKFVGQLDAQVALAQSVGFATTAINLEGGSQGSLPYQNSSGITSFLDGGADNQVLIYDLGSKKPKWGSAGDAQGAFPGIDVKDEDSTSVNNIKVLNFRGDNITAVSDSVSGVSTITIASNLVGTGLSISGISTLGITTISQLRVSGISTVGVLTATSIGIGTTNAQQNVWVEGNGYFSGVVTATQFVGQLDAQSGQAQKVGFATTATNIGSGNTGSLPYQNAPGITSFLDAPGVGTTNQVLVYRDSTDQLVWTKIGLGTHTTGNYVREIYGTSNEIEVTPSTTGAGVTHRIGFSTSPTIQGTLKINENLNVLGNITVGGTTNTLIAQDLTIRNKDIILGFTTNLDAADVSTDFTANGGGIAIASTEGSALININAVGFESNPPTYKKIMWFRANDPFVGLNTDAWLSNYAFGIGTTVMSVGTRFAAGNVQISQDDITAVRNINSTGISTFGNTSIGIKIDGTTGIITSNTGVAITFFGNLTGTASTASFATTAFNLNSPLTAKVGFATTASDVVGGIASVTQLSVSGISTFTNGPVLVGTGTSTGTASQTLQVTGGAYVSSNLGIGTTNPSTNLEVSGNSPILRISGNSGSTTRLDLSSTAAIKWSLVGNPSGSNGALTIQSNDIELIRVSNNTGNVGLGTTNPTSKLWVDGDGYFVGVITANKFVGALDATFAQAQSVGFATTAINVINGIASVSQLSVSGFSTVGVLTATSIGIGTTNATSELFVVGNSTISGIVTIGVGSTRIVIDGTAGIITATSGGLVTYFGDGSKLSNIISGVSISTNTTNQTQLITYVTGTGSTSGFGVTTTGLVFNPSRGLFGISTSSASTPLQVDRYGVRTGFGTFTAVAGVPTDIDSFVIPTTDFKTAEYTVHIQSSSSIQAQKVLVMQNGTSAFSEEYAIMYDPNFIVSIGATVSGPFCKLQFTPETGVSGLITYRFTRETML